MLIWSSPHAVSVQSTSQVSVSAPSSQSSPADAFTIMMHVHQTGLGVAGLFTRDVAETKANATRQLAEQHEFPLLVTIEPAHEDAHQ